jgi:predicted Rossmann fold flavoprotein
LHSALAALGPQDLVALVEAEGVATKVEETGKVFPVSNRAVDVLAAFEARLERSGCEVARAESLANLERIGDRFQLVTPNRTLTADRVIITTGGQSYPGSGTTGDGYRWTKSLGHTIVPPRPALVPITTSAAWVASLSGITIPDVQLRLFEPENNKPLDTRRGSMLFTHFGLSGPVVLDISRHVSGHSRPQTLRLECDFYPAANAAAVEEHFKAQIQTGGKKQLIAIVPEILPRRLAEALLQNVGLSPEQKAGELSKGGRAAIVQAIKQTSIPVTGTRGFAKAEVTAGGIALDEVDSRTMQSKLVPGLFLAGEVLDLDGPIGGYNFQAAFSTGWLAGLSV